MIKISNFNYFTVIQAGDDCMIVPTVTTEEAKELFPDGYRTIAVPSGKEYIRLTKQPQL